jgi:hypothetical protein
MVEPEQWQVASAGTCETLLPSPVHDNNLLRSRAQAAANL